MSAALKSYVPPPTPTRRRRSARILGQQPLRVTRSAAAQVEEGPQSVAVVQPVPLAPEPIRTVQVLSSLKLVSSVMAAALVGLSLVSYGASVYVDRQLSQATRRLTQLQRSEQQLTAANEVLKSHMAQQAESSAVGLMPPNPQHVIFLRPAQQRQQTAHSTPAQGPMLSLPQVARPMGY